MFGLRPGDLTRGRALIAYHFLVICASMMGRVARDAIFLDHFPASRLPLADIAAAIVAGAVVSLTIRMGRRRDLRLAQQISLVFLAVSFVALWWGLMTHQAAVLSPVLYIWIGLAGPLATTQVWTLAGSVWTAREAKRLFGILGAGGIAGGIAGGFLARAIAQHFGTDAMLLVMAIVIAPCPWLVGVAWRQRFVADVAMPAMDESPSGLRQSARTVIASPHLRSIALLIVMASMTTTIVGWQLKAIAAASLDSKDALAAYLGTFTGVTGVISLVMQLALTAPLLRRFGVGVTLLVLPLSLVAGSTAVALSGALWAVTWLRGSDAVFRYSLDASSIQLLYLPVPARQKSQVKSFIDTVVWKLGDGSAGLLLFIAATTLHVSPRGMSIVALMLSLGWIAAAVAARRRYVSALRQNILHASLKPRQSSAPAVGQLTSEVFAGAAGESDPADVRALLRDESPTVRAEALRYLMQHDTEDPLARIEDLSSFAGASIRSTAIVMLARPGDGENIEAARMILDRMVNEPGAAGRTDRLEAAQLMALIPPHFIEQLTRLMSDDDEEVRVEAVRAAGQMRLAVFIPMLVNDLAEDRLAADAAEALARMGDGAVPMLAERLDDRDAPAALRLLIPSVLVRIGTPAAAIALADNLLQADLEIRTRVISSLNKLHEARRVLDADRSQIDTAMIAELMGHYRSYQQLGARGGVADAQLSAEMTWEVERIFRLLKLLYPAVDLEAAYYGVQSRDAVTHANALEFLDNTLPPRIRALLVPLVDVDVTVRERIQLADKFLGFS